MPADLTDDDKAILAKLVRETLERDRYPLSYRVRSLKVILAKLDPSATPVVREQLPPPKPPNEPSWRTARKRPR